MNYDELSPKISSLSLERIEANKQSWIRIEKFFGEQSSLSFRRTYTAPIHELIQQVMVTDFTKLFRAGQSMLTLMISTEAEEHFASHQPFIAIEIEKDVLQIKYMHTEGNVILQSETCPGNIITLQTLEPYLLRLWNETRQNE